MGVNDELQDEVIGGHRRILAGQPVRAGIRGLLATRHQDC